MVQVLILTVTIFLGWMLLDYVKQKRITKDNVLTALVSAIVGGIVYYLLFWIL